MTTVTQESEVMSADKLTGSSVTNGRGEDLGKIEDIMLDTRTGHVAYAVLSFGGFFGLGDKLFAVPWDALQVDTQGKRFILDVPQERLKNAPGFNKDTWPSMTDRQWGSEIHTYYGYRPYWE